jgi:hypothetical protein
MSQSYDPSKNYKRYFVRSNPVQGTWEVIDQQGDDKVVASYTNVVAARQYAQQQNVKTGG